MEHCINSRLAQIYAFSWPVNAIRSPQEAKAGVWRKSTKLPRPRLPGN